MDFIIEKNKIHPHLLRFFEPVKIDKETTWKIPTQPSRENHFAPYPGKLLETPILAGCPKGGIILDPFIGTGTTAIMARKYFRKYIGIEINKNYIKICNQRLSQKFIWE